jgi:hypothetical protein
MLRDGWRRSGEKRRDGERAAHVALLSSIGLTFTTVIIPACM